MEATEIFQQLESALGNRESISPERLDQLFSETSELETKRLEEFYRSNDREAKFLGLLESKPELSKPEYEQRFAELISQYPELKSESEQLKVFESVRAITPEGSLVKLINGYAVPRSERRSGRSPKGTFPVYYPELEDLVDFKHTNGSVSEQDFLEALDMVMLLPVAGPSEPVGHQLFSIARRTAAATCRLERSSATGAAVPAGAASWIDTSTRFVALFCPSGRMRPSPGGTKSSGPRSPTM